MNFFLVFQFDGANGETLIHVGSEFTKNQKFSIEELKDRRRKDHKLDLFLAEQERRPECRRLQVNIVTISVVKKRGLKPSYIGGPHFEKK